TILREQVRGGSSMAESDGSNTGGRKRKRKSHPTSKARNRRQTAKKKAAGDRESASASAREAVHGEGFGSSRLLGLGILSAPPPALPSTSSSTCRSCQRPDREPPLPQFGGDIIVGPRPAAPQQPEGEASDQQPAKPRPAQSAQPARQQSTQSAEE